MIVWEPEDILLCIIVDAQTLNRFSDASLSLHIFSKVSPLEVIGKMEVLPFARVLRGRLNYDWYSFLLAGMVIGIVLVRRVYSTGCYANFLLGCYQLPRTTWLQLVGCGPVLRPHRFTISPIFIAPTSGESGQLSSTSDIVKRQTNNS